MLYPQQTFLVSYLHLDLKERETDLKCLLCGKLSTVLDSSNASFHLVFKPPSHLWNVNSCFHFTDKEIKDQRYLVICSIVHSKCQNQTMNPDVCKFSKLNFIMRTLLNTSYCHICWIKSLQKKLVVTNEEFTPSSSDQNHLMYRQCFLGIWIFQLYYISCHWFCSRMLAKDELITILQKCFNVLKSSSEKELGSTAKRIEEFLAQFQSLDGKNIISCQFYWLSQSFN